MNKPSYRSSTHATGLAKPTLVYLMLALLFGLTLVMAYHLYTYDSTYTTAGPFPYPDSTKVATDSVGEGAARCDPGAGEMADHRKLTLADHLAFTVTTPSNYRPDYPHPLLVVWAPSGFSEKLTEKFTGLTNAATTHGFVVVHVRSIPLGIKALATLATVPGMVMEKWCIDRTRVFYTGHSDGGTVSNALAILPQPTVQPRAVAPSAMGMQEQDLASYQCPGPTAVMLMHNRGDGHFPDYGAGVARWWAKCNGCSTDTEPSTFNGCVEYRSCAPAGRTLFCQAEGNHAHWPGFEHDVIAFFSTLAGHP